MSQLQDLKLQTIDMLIVNLYPFAQTIAKADCTVADAIENIDIGGPAMIRAASKNFRYVAVVTDPADYPDLIRELKEQEGALSLATRLRLVQKAFALTAGYDRLVANYLRQLQVCEGNLNPCRESQPMPSSLSVEYEKACPLRYGENPHQKAALYRAKGIPPHGLGSAAILQGKEISYNNFLDLDAALALVREFEEPAAVIIKHTNPCGVACAATISEAYRLAHQADPVSAFGSIIALNRTLDEKTADLIAQEFVEAILVPAMEEKAGERLREKKNLRVLLLPQFAEYGQRWRSIVGGFLVQDCDSTIESRNQCRVVTKRAPEEKEWKDLEFAWKVAKHVKSNAIVLARDGVSVGVGAGQMSRVESVEIATRKAGLRAQGAVMASDAFFPFRDGLEIAAQTGIRAVIQPGGSKRDAEVIQAADEYGIAMVFTGIRHFRH